MNAEKISEINERTFRAETLRKLLSYPALDERYRESIYSDPMMADTVSRILDVKDIQRKAETERAASLGTQTEMA